MTRKNWNIVPNDRKNGITMLVEQYLYFRLVSTQRTQKKSKQQKKGKLERPINLDHYTQGA